MGRFAYLSNSSIKLYFDYGDWNKTQEFKTEKELLQYLIDDKFIDEFWSFRRGHLKVDVKLKDSQDFSIHMYTNYHDVSNYDWRNDRKSFISVLSDVSKDVHNADLKSILLKKMKRLVKAIKAVRKQHTKKIIL